MAKSFEYEILKSDEDEGGMKRDFILPVLNMFNKREVRVYYLFIRFASTTQ